MAKEIARPDQDDAEDLIGTPSPKPKKKPSATSDGAPRSNAKGDEALDAYSVTADELRQFVEQFEQLDAEAKDIADRKKELMAEAKGRGYDTKVLRKVISERKRNPDEVAEESAVLEMYKTALGMA